MRIVGAAVRDVVHRDGVIVAFHLEVFNFHCYLASNKSKTLLNNHQLSLVAGSLACSIVEDCQQTAELAQNPEM